MPFSKKNLPKKRLAIVTFLLTFLTLWPLHSVRASVGLMYFRAVAGSSTITLEWETAQELNNLGFNLYRGLTSDFDDAQQLNSNLIPAQSGGATGAFYEWPDNNVQIGTTYTYWLEDIDTSGTATLHDPATAAATGGNTIPTVPSPGGNNNTATPTPTRTPTPNPSATTQSNATAVPTTTPTRTPAAQPTSPNPTATTASEQEPTTAPINVPPTSISPNVPAATSDPEREEPAEATPDDSFPTPEIITTTNSINPEDTTISQTLVQESPSDEDDANDGPIAQQIGQGGQDSQETASSSSTGNADESDRSPAVVMALIISVVLLLTGGGGIIVLLLNRTNQTRI